MHRRRKIAGIILYMSLIAIGLLFFFAVSYVCLYRAEKSLAQRAELTIAAEAAAGEGLDRAIYLLKRNDAWREGLTGREEGFSMSFDAAGPDAPRSINNIQGTVSVRGWGARAVPPFSAHLVCVGAKGKAVFTEEAMVAKPARYFTFALFGDEAVKLGNSSTTDSYDSSRGNYLASRQLTRGDIGTNSTRDGAVELGSFARVNTVIMTGPGGGTGTVTGPGTYGNAVSQAEPFPMQPPVPPAGARRGDVVFKEREKAALPPGVYGALTLKSFTVLTLGDGDYVIDDLLCRGKCMRLVVKGRANLYFKGRIEFGPASIINTGADPSNLMVFGTATASGFIVKQLSSASCLLYAPTAEIVIGERTEWFGSAIGRSATLDDLSRVHYDRALADLPSRSRLIHILARWRSP